MSFMFVTSLGIVSIVLRGSVFSPTQAVWRQYTLLLFFERLNLFGTRRVMSNGLQKCRVVDAPIGIAPNRPVAAGGERKLALSFPDQIHFERIAAALHVRGGIGRAAVMVGAGMSANAVSLDGTAAALPAWRQLAEAIARGLYPAGQSADERASVAARARSTSGALRLAEEFEAAHGRAALDQLLLSTIRDQDFQPGPLHRLLMSLPWSDVLTTNYDTLLERATREVPHRRYDVVMAASELAAARRPRLVKLHGSFPRSERFVITEEDFRLYPTRSAAFVNLARQAFVEQTVCLLGFSGDDPNFLQWSGWARDTLGSSVGQIYLCGILDLTGPQRKLLQDRHVAPIDLAPLFPKDDWPEPSQRHAAAIEWLLLALEAARLPGLANWPLPSAQPRTVATLPGLPPFPQMSAASALQPETPSPVFMRARS